MGIRNPLIGVTILLAACASPARAAVISGQVDNFENGDLLGWANGGASNPNPAVNVATGGPAGANDNFMRVDASGGSAGGKLVVFNGTQWAGDYSTAGVNAIQMQVNNVGPSALTLWVILAGTTKSLSTLSPVNVPAGSGWQMVSFSLAASNLTRADSTPAVPAPPADFAEVLADVVELNLVHANPGPVALRGGAQSIVGSLGVDNVAAIGVPEPGMVTLVTAAGFAGLRRRGARRRGNDSDAGP